MSAALELKKLLDRWIGIPLVSVLGGIDRLRGRVGSRDDATPRRILLIKLWGVGNLAMILPIAAAARRQFPAAEIDFLTLPENAEFLTATGLLDRVWTFSPHGAGAPFLRLAGLASRLRARRYDRIVDFEQFLRATALVTWLAAPGRSVGFRTRRQARAALYTDRLDHDERRHMALGFRDLARRAGIDVSGVPLLRVPRSTAAAGRVETALAHRGMSARPLVLVHVGSGDNFPGRRWPIESFATLGDRLNRLAGATIAFTGTAAERPLVASCRAVMGATSVDLTGAFTLTEFVELVARADLVVSNDSAPVHIAAALETPLVAIYGPNSPARYGPLSRNARVFHSGLACSPCITNSNAKTSLCRRPLCLESVAPDAVAAAALALLERGRELAPLGPPAPLAAPAAAFARTTVAAECAS